MKRSMYNFFFLTISIFIFKYSALLTIKMKTIVNVAIYQKKNIEGGRVLDGIFCIFFFRTYTLFVKKQKKKKA